MIVTFSRLHMEHRPHKGPRTLPGNTQKPVHSAKSKKGAARQRLATQAAEHVDLAQMSTPQRGSRDARTPAQIEATFNMVSRYMY